MSFNFQNKHILPTQTLNPNLPTLTLSLSYPIRYPNSYSKL